MNAKIFRLFGLLVISFFLVSCGADSSMQKGGGQNMKIWAHRGCSYAWPENTLQAFEAAAKLPVTGIELDIQLTKDGKIIVIHDETVDRTTDGSGNVRDFTLKELKELKIQTHSGLLGRKRYTSIPTIEEVFSLLKPFCLKKGLLINIELKNSVVRYEGMEDMILSLVHEYGLEPYIVYSSFNPESILLIKERKPEAEIAILNSLLQQCLDFSNAAGKDKTSALHPFIKKLDVENLRSKTSLKVRAWNSKAYEPFYPSTEKYEVQDIKALEDYGVTDIFTNIPEAYL